MKIKYSIKENTLYIGKEVTIRERPGMWNSNANGLYYGDLKFPITGKVSKILRVGELDYQNNPSMWNTVNVLYKNKHFGFCLETLEENGYRL